MIQYWQALRFEVVPFRESELRRGTRLEVDLKRLCGHGTVTALDDSQRGSEARIGLVQAHIPGRSVAKDVFQFVGSNVDACLQSRVLLHLWLQVGELLLHFSNRRHGLPGVERLSENLTTELGLLGQIFRRGRRARIHGDVQRLSESLSVDCEAHFVVSRRRARTTRCRVFLFVTRLGKFGAPREIPDETMHPGRFIENLGSSQPALSNRNWWMLRLACGSGRKAAYECVLRIEDFEFQLLGGFG